MMIFQNSIDNENPQLDPAMIIEHLSEIIPFE